MANRVVEVERFDVVDADGDTHTVIVRQTLIDAGSQDGPSWLPGLKAYRLADGRPINVQADKTLVLVETGETLRRV